MGMIIGIDPGMTGAIALLDREGGLIDVLDMPTMKVDKGNEVNAASLAASLGYWMGGELPSNSLVALEKVHSMPGQGVSSTFRFGESYGVIKGVLSAIGIPYRTITPQAWKKRYSLIGKDKDCARGLAQQLYPKASLVRKKDTGRADALLIARYALEVL